MKVEELEHAEAGLSAAVANAPEPQQRSAKAIERRAQRASERARGLTPCRPGVPLAKLLPAGPERDADFRERWLGGEG